MLKLFNVFYTGQFVALILIEGFCDLFIFLGFLVKIYDLFTILIFFVNVKKHCIPIKINSYTVHYDKFMCICMNIYSMCLFIPQCFYWIKQCCLSGRIYSKYNTYSTGYSNSNYNRINRHCTFHTH